MFDVVNFCNVCLVLSVLSSLGVALFLACPVFLSCVSDLVLSDLVLSYCFMFFFLVLYCWVLVLRFGHALWSLVFGIWFGFED